MLSGNYQFVHAYLSFGVVTDIPFTLKKTLIKTGFLIELQEFLIYFSFCFYLYMVFQEFPFILWLIFH